MQSYENGTMMFSYYLYYREINSKGGLFVLCRDCKNESKKKRTKKSQKVCVITSVNKGKLPSIKLLYHTVYV